MEIKFYINDQAELAMFGEFHAKLEEKRAAGLEAYHKEVLGVIGKIEPKQETLDEIAAEASSPVTAVAEIAPEVVKVVKARAKKPKADAEPVADPYPETEAEKAAVVQPKAEIPTLEETKEVIQAFANARSVPEATELLAKHGATKLKDLPEDKRAPLIAAMKAVMEAK